MRVEIINDIFSKEDFEWINEKSLTILSDGIGLSQNTRWDHKIVEFSKPVSIYNVSDEDSHKINTMMRNTNISPLNKNVMKGCMLYYWYPGSYIPWHTDATHSAGLTIHLNDEWEYHMGGLFQYNDGNLGLVSPKKNLGVLQIGGVPHSTTIISENSPIRRTVQIFFDKFNDEPSKLI